MMANLINLQKFLSYLVEKHPDLSELDIAADHEKLYLPIPASKEEFNLLEKKAKEFNLVVYEDEDSLLVII